MRSPLPLRHRLCLLLALGLIGGAQAAGCPALPAPSVQLIRLEPEVSLNHQLDHAQLQALIPVAQRSGNPVPGLTHANASTRYRLEMRTLPSLDGQGECASPRLTVHYGFTPITIYISRTLPSGSCAYNEVLAHEQRHLAAYQQHARDIEAALRHTLEARFLKAPAGPQAVGEAQRSMQRALQEDWKPHLRQKLAEAQNAQQAIDTDEEYRRLNVACRGEIRDRLGP